MKKNLTFKVAGLALTLASYNAHAVIIDFTAGVNTCTSTPGGSCTNILGTNFGQIDGSNNSISDAALFANPANKLNVGTGVIDPFLKLNGAANTTATGFNVDVNLNPGDPGFQSDVVYAKTNAITIGSIASVVINGIDYRVFGLDVDQQNNVAERKISLDTLQVFVGTTPDPSGYTAGPPPAFNAATNATLIYDMDALTASSVYLDYDLFSGSGIGMDMEFLLPSSLFVGRASTDYVYFYSHFGDTYDENDGPEEWWKMQANGVNPPPQPPQPPETVPEPGILSLLGLGLLGLGARARRKNA